VADAVPARNRFGDLTLDAFVQRLASNEPVPGGGSASAVAGALGGALVAMVASLSLDRPKYAAHAELHARAAERGRALAKRFLDLADEDADAYGAFAAAMKLPRDTDEQRDVRTAALREAARGAATVPMRTVEACVELAALAKELVGRSNMNAASDLNVAAMLAEAAARGAAENVIVNLPAVGDEAYAADTTIRVKTLLDAVESLAAETREGVLSGEGREPTPR
jgi:methenyltetrahydrofolate cyclohydrolase